MSFPFSGIKVFFLGGGLSIGDSVYQSAEDKDNRQIEFALFKFLF